MNIPDAPQLLQDLREERHHDKERKEVRPDLETEETLLVHREFCASEF